MIYDHVVKFRGKYYAAGEEIPEKEIEEKVEDIPVPSEQEETSKRGRPPKKTN